MTRTNGHIECMLCWFVPRKADVQSFARWFRDVAENGDIRSLQIISYKRNKTHLFELLSKLANLFSYERLNDLTTKKHAGVLEL